MVSLIGLARAVRELAVSAHPVHRAMSAHPEMVAGPARDVTVLMRLVPGLAAKDVVDVLVGIDDPDDEAAYLPDLEAAGYEVRVREPGHRALRETTGRRVNVHCYAPEGDEVVRYRRFRDLLRADPEARQEYEDVKRSLAGREWPDMNHYAEAKGPTIRRLGALRAREH